MSAFQIIRNKSNPLYGESYNKVKLAVQQNGYALRYVHQQTEELCRLAVQQNGDVLQYVEDQFLPTIAA